MGMASKLVELVTGGAICQCAECDGFFVQFQRGNGPQELCPKCMDTSQVRPSIVEERGALYCFDAVQIESLPPLEWQEFHTGWARDSGKLKMDIGRKSLFGDDIQSWQGRIVIWSGSPLKIGDVCEVRVMRATHSFPSGAKETREYIVLSRRNLFPTYKLVWGESAPENATWRKEVSAVSSSGETLGAALSVVPLLDEEEPRRRIFSPSSDVPDDEWEEYDEYDE